MKTAMFLALAALVIGCGSGDAGTGPDEGSGGSVSTGGASSTGGMPGTGGGGGDAVGGAGGLAPPSDCGHLDFAEACTPADGVASAAANVAICYRTVDANGLASDMAVRCFTSIGGVTKTCEAYCY